MKNNKIFILGLENLSYEDPEGKYVWVCRSSNISIAKVVADNSEREWQYTIKTLITKIGDLFLDLFFRL